MAISDFQAGCNVGESEARYTSRNNLFESSASLAFVSTMVILSMAVLGFDLSQPANIVRTAVSVILPWAPAVLSEYNLKRYGGKK